MIRLKRLAKLRQYKDGSIADYLKTEHRQNLLAIEDALNIEGGGSQNNIPDVNDVLWIWTQKNDFANVKTAVATNQPVNLSDADSTSVLNFGTIENSTFRPGFEGKLLVEMRFVARFSTVSRTMEIKLSTGDPLQFLTGVFATDAGGSVAANRDFSAIWDVKQGTIISIKYSSTISTTFVNGGCLTLKFTRVG